MLAKLDKPLYHGTCAHFAKIINAKCCLGRNSFRLPLYLTDNKDMAIHYAQAATAYTENLASEENVQLYKTGYAIFTFTSLPVSKDDTLDNILTIDDYNLDYEKGQYKYLRDIRTVCYQLEYFPLEVSQEEHLKLQCFAFGMWRQ